MRIQRPATQLFGALLISSFASAQLNSTTVNNTSSSACPSEGGAHIIAARGSTVKPQPGYGSIGTLKDNILQRVPGSTAEFVNYPATLSDYINSESQGVLAMRKSINDYISRCSPSLPLIIMGYSQGAQVTADSLVGQDVAGFPLNASISQPSSASTLSRVTAVVMMGDPSFVTNETFHVGNATKNGIFPRRDVANFNIAGLASRTRSYCDFNDPYCAAGNISTGLGVHIGYIQEYGAAAEDFVVGQIKAFYANGTLTKNGSEITETTSGAALMLRERGQLNVVSAALLAGLLGWLL